MLTLGSEGAYEWLVTDQQFDLLQLCPQVVLGKFVAITSIDSSPFIPTAQEIAAGWQTQGGIGYSPRIQGIRELPRAGWDEWYVFDHPADLGTSHLGENIFEVPHVRGHVGVFVNYCFALHRPEVRDLIDLFWQQMDWIRPICYLADNDYLTFVTVDRNLFARVREAVSKIDG